MKIHSTLLKTLLVAAALGMAANARAAFLVISLPGSSTEDQWTGLTATNFPGYPTYTTSANLWPAPIGSTSGTGDLDFNKISGLGFPSNGGGIYVGGMTSGTGVYSIATSATGALNALETVVFQIEIEGVGANWSDVFSGLSLNYNGGTQSLAANFFQEVSAINTGTMFGEPATRFTLAFQWDLSAVVDPITAFDFQWTAAEHSLTYNLQVNQGDTMVQVVPEPTTCVLLALSAAGFVVWKRRTTGRSS